jgi:hypothetical protein
MNSFEISKLTLFEQLLDYRFDVNEETFNEKIGDGTYVTGTQQMEIYNVGMVYTLATEHPSFVKIFNNEFKEYVKKMFNTYSYFRNESSDEENWRDYHIRKLHNTSQDYYYSNGAYNQYGIMSIQIDKLIEMYFHE